MARKPNPISKVEINEIVSLIKIKGSIPINHPVDCKTLSYHINTITGKYISESTIKRIFGFTKNDFSPSYDTINILKQYTELHIKKPNQRSTVDFIMDFFNPLHFEDINKADKGFQAACRSIAVHLKNDLTLLEQVMEPLAKIENGRRFYYDLFPDYELISSIQYKGYEKYLQHEKSYEGKIFANCILFMRSFFDNNLKAMKSKWESLSLLYEKNKKLHPFVLGRYCQIQLISNVHFNSSEVSKIKKEIFSIEKKMPRNESGLFMEFPGFHYFVCDGLWHIKAYEELLELSKIALTDFKKHNEFIWKGYYDQLYLYQGLALMNLGKKSAAKKLISQIKPERFYFPTKKYFETLYSEFTKSLD